MQLSRRHILAYAAVAAVVVAVGVRYLVAPHTSSASAGTGVALGAVLPSASSAAVATNPSQAAAAPSSSPAADVLVYVCGAVRTPGVVRLPEGARVAEAVDLAGGATGKAQLDGVNLAAKVADGQQIVVPERGAAPAAASGAAASTASGGSSAASAAAAPVNINTATLEELDALQGVGPATAQKIIDYRTANGPFKRIEDIKNVSGIGDAKFAAMKDSITV
jgi:competence protein ComEA